MKHISFFLLTVLFTVFSLFSNAQEAFDPAQIFGDNMVLQQKQPIAVWGKAKSGTTVKVSLAGVSANTTVQQDGKWLLYLPELSAGGPYKMLLTCGKEKITYSNILVGEVWFASGQSNMAFQLKRCRNAEKEIAEANHPKIRLFTVPNVISYAPKNDLDSGEWKVCTSETAADFSGVAYFFAREINRTQEVPVGVINASWGGTRAESWTSRPALYAMNDFRQRINELAENPIDFEKEHQKNQSKKAKQESLIKTAGEGLKQGVHKVAYDGSWESMKIPTHWHNTKMSGYEGFMWYRKIIDLPKKYHKKPLLLRMGKIEQKDITYFNGQEVGRCDTTSKLRYYHIPKRTAQAGKNVIAVRVLHMRHEGGGFYEGPFDLLDPKDSSVIVSLEGEWLYSINIEPQIPQIKRYVDEPGALFGGMVAPIIPYSIRGVIWYQGESNAGRAYQYRELFPLMITDWRVRWQQGYFPFYFVQLANFLAVDEEPRTDPFTELREAQSMTLAWPNTGMASAIDIGEAMDIHPKNKQDVGKRLALNARAKTYGEDIVYSGPTFENMNIEGNKVEISFTHTGSGLAIKGGQELKGFAIAGEDQTFYWAKARLAGDKVIVWSEKVAKPVAVRYAWSNNPVCNLYNKEGLPANPFRTDDWPGVTYGKR